MSETLSPGLAALSDFIAENAARRPACREAAARQLRDLARAALYDALERIRSDDDLIGACHAAQGVGDAAYVAALLLGRN